MSKVAEQELVAAAVAPRVTLEQLEATIASEHYFTAADGVDGAFLTDKRAEDAYEPVTFIPLKYDNTRDGTPMADLALLTFCVLRLQNGFTVHGFSACASPANYNREIGERLAREDAVKKLWPLLGYELKTKLHLSSQGADLPQDKAEAQPSAASPGGAGEATGG